MIDLLLLAIAFSGTARDEAPETKPIRSILVSRQLLQSEHLALGDVVSLSTEPSGVPSQLFRVAGSYEPVPDPARLGTPRLEVRLHLPDLIGLDASPSDEKVGAINVRLENPAEAATFAREVSARMPGTVARPTADSGDAADPFVVLERFHLAIALVTVITSSTFLLALMVMVVEERRDAVAVLRLIGLSRRRILLQVLSEGLILAVVGTVFGVLLAELVEGVFNSFFRWHYDTMLTFVRISPGVVGRSTLLAMPLGILASLASSWNLLRREVLALAGR